MNLGTTCPSGGSFVTSGTKYSIGFVASNCLQSGGTTVNGSTTLNWSNVNYITCGSNQIPTNLNNTYTFNNFTVISKNPTISISGNGMIAVNETAYSCTSNAPTITMDLTISPSSPSTFTFIISSPTASFSLDATIASMTERTIFVYDSTGSLKNISSTISAIYTSPGIPGTFSITTNSPFQWNPQVSSGISSGSMTISNSNGENVTVTADPNAQVTVVTTTNGSSQSTTEAWTALLGS